MSEAPEGACQFQADRLVLRFELTLAGTVAAIEPAVQQILAVVATMGCGRGKELAIETAVREALANAVVHGCRDDPSKSVTISAYCDEDRGMILVVRDPGTGFDPQVVPSPIHGDRLFEDHGRGIYLIQTLMDEVRFREGGTEIWMRKA
jgi:serine/threonine-protein kinase RsbW